MALLSHCIATTTTERLPPGTLSTLVALEADFEAVRLVFHHDGAEPWRIDAAAVAPSARVHDGCDPVDAAGRPVGFTPVSFGAEAPGAPRWSHDLSRGREPGGFALACSEWIPLASLPRADAGSDGRPLLVCRVHSATGLVAGRSASLVAPQGWPAEHEGRLLIGRHCGPGDATRAALGGAAGRSRWHLPAIIQYRAARAGATVLAVGDSLTQGVVTAGGEAYAWGHYATAMLSTRARPVGFVNGGRAGQPSTVYRAHGRLLLDWLRPEIVTISVWSPNDGKTAADADQAWQGALDLAREAAARGAVPILATAVPFNLRPRHDALRQANNARARGLAAQGGMLLADLDAVLADPADPAAAAPPFRAPKGNHLSVAGYRACGAAATPIIARALAHLGLETRGA